MLYMQKNKSKKSIRDFFKDIKNKFKTRNFIHASVSNIVMIIVLACTVFLNMIFNLLGNKFDLSLDLTKNKAFTLTDNSKKFIKSISKDVEIIVLNDENSFSNLDRYFKQANCVITQYAKESNKVRLNYVDIVKDPLYLQNKEFSSEKLNTNSIIVKSGSKYKVISVNDLFDISYGYYGQSEITASKAEQELTSAILYVTSDNQKDVVFLTGYEEADYTSFSELLKKNNYNVKEVSILTQDIPSDAYCVFIFAPSRDYDNTGIEKLKKYINSKDSSLVYAVNPELKKAEKIENFLNDWKIKVKEGLVYETDVNKLTSNGNIFTAISDYVDEEYLKNFKDKKIPVLLPFCRPLESQDSESVKVLLQFSNTSGVMPVGSSNENFDLKANVCGPIPSVLISKKTINESKNTVTVLGSFAGLTQGYLEATSINNSSYFISLIDSITKKENVGITIEPKSIENEELGINAATVNMISFSVIGLLPLIVILLGIFMFLKRRHL